MKASKIFYELGWCKAIVNKVEEDYNTGVIHIDDVIYALRKVNEYLNIVLDDVENM